MDKTLLLFGKRDRAGRLQEIARPAIALKSSAISHQLSVISYELSVICYWLI
ncbi:MAG: hypothetical protein MUE44_26405 [Oscillatoriaceae cyanobacterium Prado104]|jgi:hypothetical protein|nr:hypothetical protein [Oscillatoriaceae cyanobacterium Prado104]